MANYIINEYQLTKIVNNLKEDEVKKEDKKEEKKEMSSADAMRKIVSVLKKNGYEDEEIVDVIIGLRQKDKMSHIKAKRIKDEPEYDLSIDRLYSK